MTDREAMLILAKPEPDYCDDPQTWQIWNDRRIAALVHAREALSWLCPWCNVRWLDGDPFADVRKELNVIGCPNCGNTEDRKPDA
jgi:predicted RNA-binding Zn-ribbon protein involved in translation (DUF1610 family)